MPRQNVTAWGLLLFGALLGAVLTMLATDWRMPKSEAQDARKAPDLAALTAEIETIKGKLPDQAHAMQDVGYHFTNLWFAGQKEHWDLANFYWLEVRSHLRWAVRIIPKRKDLAGREIDLPAILQAFENTPLKQLEDSIKANDKTKFDEAYRFTLESCYACHKASDKPFIRPQMPSQPEAHIINFDPKADWPK
ncbi:MAG: hypothetical protein WD894_00085 [Pirellulales bacterium]